MLRRLWIICGGLCAVCLLALMFRQIGPFELVMLIGAAFLVWTAVYFLKRA